MQAMTKEGLLEYLNRKGVPAARELQQQQEESQQMQAASRAALKDAARFARTTEGRKSWQTLLTAHAYDGGGGASTVPDFRKAEILGVHPSQFSAARQRARSLQPTLPPAAALDQNAYWYQPRARRSDATPPVLVQLMKEFWHNGEVSRLTGNSRHIFRESKSPDAETHPRRQLMVEGGAKQYSPSS